MSQFKLLVVDDEPIIVELFQKIYGAKGYIAFGVTDGIEAVTLYEKERPELTFIDVHMPYSPIDGIEVLRRIKAIDKEASCVMVTRIDDKKAIEDSRAAGAMHYIMKPFELEDLDGCIKEVEEILRAKG